MNQWATNASSEESTFFDIQHLDVGSKIQLHDKIALGGHSDVWFGTLDSIEGKIQVAIKELRVRHHQSNMSLEERLRRRFFREVALWSRLHHQNVVPLLGFAISSDSLPKLISPWYKHGSIIEYLQKYPNADRLKLLLDIARAVSYLHSLPLVHGDIKGDNILVDASGTASLCDFGLSKFIDDALHITGFTTTGQFGGTPRFLAPELLNEEPPSKLTDVWAFGCAAIQIMTGLLPYPAISSITAIQRAIICGDPPLPREYRASTDQEMLLWEEVRRCWTKAPQRPDIDTLTVHIDSISLYHSSTVSAHRANSSISNSILPTANIRYQRRGHGTLNPQAIKTTRNLALSVFNPDPYGDDVISRPSRRPLPPIPPKTDQRGGNHPTMVSRPDALIAQASSATYQGDPSQSHRPSEPRFSEDRILVTITVDGKIHQITDITEAKDAFSVRECIYSKVGFLCVKHYGRALTHWNLCSQLQIPSDERRSCEIYRIEAEDGFLGSPLGDDTLMIYCSAWGDNKGTLKFLVKTDIR